MANKKISELAVATAPTGAELIEIVQGGVNKQTTTQDIANLGGGGSVTSVTGTANRITSTGGATPVIDIDAAYDATHVRGRPMVAATGAVISFAIPQYYGSAAAITGNITFSTTGAVLGMEQVMRHNDSAEPTLSSEFKEMQGSRTYVPSVDNYLYCKYLSATKIQYTWNQEV